MVVGSRSQKTGFPSPQLGTVLVTWAIHLLLIQHYGEFQLDFFFFWNFKKLNVFYQNKVLPLLLAKIITSSK